MKRLKELFQWLGLISVLSFVLLYSPYSVMASELISWDKVASTSEGEQFIDSQSIKYKKGILSVFTKYSEFNPDTQETLNTISYQMDIDCEKRLFRKDQETKWEAPETKLMKKVIIKSCSY
tara:strand:- start:173 stop:535 length:363 start_codon:yes stop_codon:yes gene_type:complete